jgi:hypothetical protein
MRAGQRPTIGADGAAEAPALVTLLALIVVDAAEALKWPGPEPHRVAAVSLDMVTDHGNRKRAGCLAERTPRVGPQLFAPYVLPPLRSIPGAIGLRGLASPASC